MTAYRYIEERDYPELIAISVEQVLIEHAVNVWKNIEQRLKSEFNAKFIDCYEYPEYLRTLLKKHHMDFYDQIINSLKDYLIEFESDEKISKFLSKL